MTRSQQRATRVGVFTLLALATATAGTLTIAPQLTVSQDCRAFNHNVVGLLDRGKLQESLTTLRAGLAEGSFKGEPACLSITLLNLASTLAKVGRTSEAEVPAAQSVALLSNLTADDDPVRLQPLQTLWFVSSELGEVARARQAYQAVRALRVVSPHDKATVLSISAAQLRLEGRHSQAEKSYLLALSAWEALGSESSIEMASLLCDLGIEYAEQNRPSDAEKTLGRAVRLISSAPGATPADIVRVSNQQAFVHARQGRWELACSELNGLVAFGERSELGGSLLKELYSNYAFTLRKTHQKRAARAIEARAAAISSELPSDAVIDVSAFTAGKRIR